MTPLARERLAPFARSVAEEPWAACMMTATDPVLRRLGAALIVENARLDRRAAYLAARRKIRSDTRRRTSTTAPGRGDLERIKRESETKMQELGHVIRYAEKVGVGVFVKALVGEAETLAKLAGTNDRTKVLDRTRRMVLRLYAQRMRTAALRLVLDAGMQRVLVDRR